MLVVVIIIMRVTELLIKLDHIFVIVWNVVVWCESVNRLINGDKCTLILFSFSFSLTLFAEDSHSSSGSINGDGEYLLLY